MKFRGEHRWLSNFAPVNVKFEGVTYRSTEHAYQAAKTLDLLEREQIHACATPGKAKRLSRTLTLRSDWESVKARVMLDLTRQKYRKPEYRRKLLQTGDYQIVEGNTWGDTYWGVCRGKGENRLGKIIMQVREEIRA